MFVRTLIFDKVCSIYASHALFRLGRATVYQYFRDKAEVALAYWERAEIATQRELIAVRDAETFDIPERLTRLLVARVMLGFDAVEPYQFQITELLAKLRAAFLAQRRDFALQEARIIEPLLLAGKQQGRFAFDDALETALSLLGATNALLPLGLTQAELGNRDDIEHQARRLAAILVRGILSGNALDDQAANP